MWKLKLAEFSCSWQIYVQLTIVDFGQFDLTPAELAWHILLSQSGPGSAGSHRKQLVAYSFRCARSG